MYTVIISSVGREKYLNELLQSIQCQTKKAGEILLLLDDNFHCKKIKIREIPNLKIYFLKNKNLPQKRNIGASLSAFDLILFSDDDDIWENKKAEVAITKLNKYDVICHNFDKFGYINKEHCSKLGLKDRRIDKYFLLFGDNFFGGGSSISTKKNVILDTPFNEKYNYCEDIEWWTRVLLKKVNIFYIGKSLVRYRSHESNMTKALKGIYLNNIKLSYGLICDLKLFHILVGFIFLFRQTLKFTIQITYSYAKKIQKNFSCNKCL
jgi:hypothetical protein